MEAKEAPALERALAIARETKAVAIRRDPKGRILFSYLWPAPELFASEEGRELRGIVYREADGRLLSRPFHKFFNYKEPPWGLGAESFSGPVLLGEKVDGYLLQAFLDGEELVLASRHSLNPPLVGRLAWPLWTEEVDREARRLLAREAVTLLFEVVDPEAPVLVRHARARLALICARRLDTGEYLFPGWDFPWKDHISWKETHIDPDRFWREVGELSGQEGFVAFLPDLGEFVKFKSGWAFHVADFLKDPAKRFLEAYTSERLDDLLGALQGREDLQERVLVARKELDSLYQRAIALGESLRNLPRKEAWMRATDEAKEWGDLASAFTTAVMKAYAREEPRKPFLRSIQGRKGEEAVQRFLRFSPPEIE